MKKKRENESMPDWKFDFCLLIKVKGYFVFFNLLIFFESNNDQEERNSQQNFLQT